MALLDFRLALRMLARYPLLTIVGTLGMAFGLAAGDRAVRLGDADYRAWLAQVTRVEDLGAAALVERNLAVDGNPEPVRVAEMTASAFRMARVRPLAGRPILESDESPGAAPVAVIGHSLWQRRFLRDARVVGRVVQLGGEQTTIVGVMPDGFWFPAAHEVWVPWTAQAASTTPAPALLVFGRLANGVTLEEAQAELTVVGQRRAAADP